MHLHYIGPLRLLQMNFYCGASATVTIDLPKPADPVSKSLIRKGIFELIVKIQNYIQLTFFFELFIHTLPSLIK